MEFNKKSIHDYDHQPFFLPNNNNNFLNKPEEINEEFSSNSYASKGFLQDFQHLDDQLCFSNSPSSFNPDLGVQTMGFDPFYHGPDIDFLEYKPFDHQNFHGGDQFFNFSNNRSTPMSLNLSDKNRVPLNSEYFKPLISFVVPPDDQSSCITAESEYNKENGMKKSTKASGKKPVRGRKKSKSAKGQWSMEEDRLLIHLVEKYGVRKWSHIAQMLKGRIGKQCRERWHNHLRPDIKKDLWSEEEDRILIEGHTEVGNKWAEIAKRLPGRTENSIKNHWNATKRRQFSKRKCRTKWPRPSSLLQNYIKSLNFETGSSNINNPTNNSSTLINSNSTHNNVAPPPPKQEIIEFCSGDLLIPEYDFSEVPEFELDDNLFEGSSSIDSFIDNLAVAAIPHDDPFLDDDDDEKLGFCSSEIMPYDDHNNIPQLMQCEVKKELDFMLISN